MKFMLRPVQALGSVAALLLLSACGATGDRQSSATLDSNTAQAANERGQYWLVSGEIEVGATQFDPIFELEALGNSAEGVGGFSIEIRDSSDRVLFTRRFDPSIAMTETNSDDYVSPPFFTELLPVQSGAASIVVLEGVSELGEVEFEGIVPSVEITFPAGGETIAGRATIAWKITDPDSASHSYWIQYSPDGGTTWHTLAPNYAYPDLRIDFDELPGSTTHSLIRVVASDGVNSSTALSEPFSIGSKGPEVEIFFPPDGEIFRGGQLVWLQGFGFDPDDGTLGGSNLTWESNIDGVLGNGDELQLTTLSEGTHEVKLVATDLDGNSEVVSIEILIDDTAPSLEVSAPPSLSVRECAVVEIYVEDVGGSGLSTVEYSLDAGETWTTIPPGELPYEFIVPGVEQVHLVARALDNAGNLSADDRRYYFERECNEANLSGDN